MNSNALQQPLYGQQQQHHHHQQQQQHHQQQQQQQQQQQHVAGLPSMTYGTTAYYDQSLSSTYYQPMEYGVNYQQSFAQPTSNYGSSSTARLGSVSLLSADPGTGYNAPTAFSQPLYQQQSSQSGAMAQYQIPQLQHAPAQPPFYGRQLQTSTFDGSNDIPPSQVLANQHGTQSHLLPRPQSSPSSHMMPPNPDRRHFSADQQSHAVNTYPNQSPNMALNASISGESRPAVASLPRSTSQFVVPESGQNRPNLQQQPMSQPSSRPSNHLQAPQKPYEQPQIREKQTPAHLQHAQILTQPSIPPQVKAEYQTQASVLPAPQIPVTSEGPKLATSLKPQQKSATKKLPTHRGGQTTQGPSRAPAHTVKRQKSEGVAATVTSKSGPKVNGHAHMQAARQLPASSPLTELASSQFPPTPPNHPSVDYQAALLTLSDEYITAAYSISTSLAGGEVVEDRLDEYFALLSTGMSCLESVLNNYRILDARKEACIRLRLASLMYEETDNDSDAEAILTKGIALCERARLSDPKYSMHHLLARIWFKAGQARAAMKAVDKLIDEVQKLHLTHWVYVFRFLRVSFGLQTDTAHQELGALVKQLAAVVVAASQTHAVAVIIVASGMEALMHLRAQTPDSVDLAQRALATARTHQLSAEMAAMPQVRALLDAADLACHLTRLNPDQATTKLSNFRKNLDDYYEDPEQSKDGCWLLPLSEFAANSDDIERDTGGILRQTPMGQYGLSMSWLTRTQATTLGFLLSGVTSLQKANIEQMPETFLGEGISLNKVALENNRESLSTASRHTSWQDRMRITLQAYVVFSRCARADWEVAMKGMGSIRQYIVTAGVTLDEDTAVLVDYLEAIGKHGLGHLKQALDLYRKPSLRLPAALDSRAFQSINSAHLKVLAALNSILILRKLGASAEADALLHRIEPMCITQYSSNGSEHGNKAMESAFHALKATAPEMTIIKTKQYIQFAIGAAQKVGNDRLLNIVMNHMTHLFFANIVGRQAEQSAKVGRALAKRSGDRLWMAVADRMLCETAEKSGNMTEAQTAIQEGEQAMSRLPESLKAALFAPEL
jgi:hypothetical protein